MIKPRKEIEDIKPYSTKLFDEGDFLRLDGNENDFGCSPKVLNVLRKSKIEDLSYYPCYGEILNKLADFHSIKPENITVTAGADEAISVIFACFGVNGGSILTVKPSFVMPKLYAQINGINYKEIPYKKKWEFPIEDFLNNIDDEIRLIHLTTPNSPTGEVISKEDIQKILDKAKDKVILIDETYMNYADCTNLEFLRENVFIVRSFSKDFALAGLRLGYIISAEENIQNLRKYLSPYNVSKLTVKAGVEAISDFKYFKKIKKELEISKEVLKKGLENLGAIVYPSKTNFLCVDFGEKAEFVYKKLIDNKIKVKFFKEEGLLKNTFRITVPTLKNTKRFLKALKIKPIVVFDMDGVLINTMNSYRVAVKKTFEHFCEKTISFKEIQAAKNLGGLNNDWDLTEYLLKQEGKFIEKQEIINIFQSMYFDGKKGLIDEELALVDEKFLKKLSKKYNLGIFTGRPKEEAFYTLEKNGFTTYFDVVITMDDLPLDRQKPDTLGLELIKERVLTDKIYYLGDTQDDMKCAKNFGAFGIGVLPPQDKSQELKQAFKSEKAMLILNETKDLLRKLK